VCARPAGPFGPALSAAPHRIRNPRRRDRFAPFAAARVISLRRIGDAPSDVMPIDFTDPATAPTEPLRRSTTAGPTD